MSVNMEEAVLERNLRRFVLVRTAEPVYLELREGLILIRHQSKYGSSLLTAFWCRVFQHPNNYPVFRFPYRKLYDTKGMWKIVLRLDDVIVTIFTKTGTLSIKGTYVLEWFMDRFQGIMDAVDAPIQHPQPIRNTKQKQSMSGQKPAVDGHLSNYRTSSRNARSASRPTTKSNDTVYDQSTDKIELPGVHNLKEQCNLPEMNNKLMITADESIRVRSRPLSGRFNRPPVDGPQPGFRGSVHTGFDPILSTEKYPKPCSHFTNGINEIDNEKLWVTGTSDGIDVNMIQTDQPAVSKSVGIDTQNEESEPTGGHTVSPQCEAEISTDVTAQDLDDIFGVNVNATGTEKDSDVDNVACLNDETIPVEEQPTDIMDEGGLHSSPNRPQVENGNILDLLTDVNQNKMVHFGNSTNDDSFNFKNQDQPDIGNISLGLMNDVLYAPCIGINNTECNIDSAFANDLIDIEPAPFNLEEQAVNSLFVSGDSIQPEKKPTSNRARNATREQSTPDQNERGDNSMVPELTLGSINDGYSRDNWSMRQRLTELNQHLSLQELDLWYGPSLDTELDRLAVPSVKEGNYVYTLWKSVLQKLMSTENCKLYMASPFLDKPRLQDICHTFLRNRLTACVDAVHVKRHTESGQLISDVKWNAIREFPANEQAVLEYKLYSSFLYPFVEFHYRFVAGVVGGEAEVLITSADFHGNHFETDNLDMVTYIKMSEGDFRTKFLNPLMK